MTASCSGPLLPVRTHEKPKPCRRLRHWLRMQLRNCWLFSAVAELQTSQANGSPSPAAS